MEDNDHSEPALAFPDPEEELVIIEHFENDFFSQIQILRKLPTHRLFSLAQSVTNVVEA